jgi:hypothetical protein
MHVKLPAKTESFAILNKQEWHKITTGQRFCSNHYWAGDTWRQIYECLGQSENYDKLSNWKFHMIIYFDLQLQWVAW